MSDAEVAGRDAIVRRNRPTGLAAAFFCGVATMGVALLITWKLLLRHPAGLRVSQLWPWVTPTFVAIAATGLLFTVVLAVLDRSVERDLRSTTTKTARR
jgi:hypothetical protein